MLGFPQGWTAMKRASVAFLNRCYGDVRADGLFDNMPMAQFGFRNSGLVASELLPH